MAEDDVSKADLDIAEDKDRDTDHWDPYGPALFKTFRKGSRPLVEALYPKTTDLAARTLSGINGGER
ncbi:hypothetical protein PG993_013156 [Apiospora rasikravindrae]|uniref:Uncharacterized protein n=1 Tax=Apiospora rasikravindrae TaxID=990691 RepID=A0ABR1RWV9_9PEZI